MLSSSKKKRLNRKGPRTQELMMNLLHLKKTKTTWTIKDTIQDQTRDRSLQAQIR